MTSMWLRTLTCVVLLAGLASASHGQTHKDIKAAEIARLPQFCWEQYGAAQGPQYRIGRDCGPMMNHYCGALVELLRAKKSAGDRIKRLTHLKLARESAIYTHSGMEKYPSCSIRDHVMRSMREIDSMITGLGAK